MSDLDTPKPCIRGCLTPRQHTPDCDTDDCPGCAPRLRQHGLLCYTCHARLRSHLQVIHGQWALLIVTGGKSLEQLLAAETTARPSNAPRVDSSAKFPGPWAHATVATAAGTEPVRLAALDAAQALADWLSETVEHVATTHNAAGPKPLQASDPDPRRWKWHPFSPDGKPATRYDKVTVHRGDHEVMRGQYVLTDPPDTFAVDTAANWLLAWLDRFEEMPTIGDDLETLNDLMAQAHALAPWREQVARLRGIPCPYCHHKALVRFGGDEDVTCLHCRTMIPPGRYLIWVRQLVADSKGQRDPDDRRSRRRTRDHTGSGASAGASG